MMVKLKNNIVNVSLTIVLIVMLFRPYLINIFNKYSFPLLFIFISFLLLFYDIIKNKGYEKNKFYPLILITVVFLSLYNNAYLIDKKFGIYLYYVSSIMYGCFLYFSNHKRINYDLFFKIILYFSLLTSLTTWISFIFPNFYITNFVPLLPKDLQNTVIYDFIKYKAMPGLTDHYSRNAIFIIFGIISSIYFVKKDNKKTYLPIIVLFITLLLIGKRGPLIFLVTSLIICYFLKYNLSKDSITKLIKIGFFSLVILFVIFLMIPGTNTIFIRFFNSIDISNGRFRLYSYAFKLLKNNYYFPIGFAQFAKLNNYTVAAVHNDYIQILIETGIIGFIAIIGGNILFLIQSIRYYKKENSSLSLIILFYNIFFLLYSLTGLPHYDFETLLIYFIFNAFLFNNSLKYKEFNANYILFFGDNFKENLKSLLEKLKILNATMYIKHFVEYYIISFLYLFIKKEKYDILTDEETVKRIVEDKMSIARYGDGEFKWMLKIKQINFQDDNDILSEKLEFIIKENNSKLLIGIPSLINSMNGFTLEAKWYWKKFLLKNYIKLKKYLSKDRIYCDSYITRQYIDKEVKDYKQMKLRFDNFKKIWNKKDVLIVEGEYSRLGLDNDLFDNCKSIKRIVCPYKNAFNKYDEIYNSILKNAKNRLILLSLGPTATILASELSKVGKQCIDVGHIDLEYMWFRNGSRKKEKVAGKIVNEIGDNGYISDIEDIEYLKQIVDRIDL